MKKFNIILMTLVLTALICIGCAGEASVKKNQFTGTWFDEENCCLWIFNGNGSFRALTPESHRVSSDEFEYSVNEKEIHFKISLDGEEIVRIYSFDFSDNDRLILTKPEYEDVRIELTRVKDSSGNGNPIVGTWTAFDREYFDFHINNISYGDTESLSFYNDGTFRVITKGGEGSGEYTFLFDGEVLQMDCGWSVGEFDYELFSDEFMLIEFSIYNGEMQFGYLMRKAS